MADYAVCCNEPQTAFGLLYLLYFVIVLVTWGSILVKPMRLMATFVHEMSHAIACWVSCGSVRGIEVYNNEGGVTKYVGGCRCLIIPAGYLGEAFWGMIFTVMSGGRRTSTMAAAGFVFSLLLALCYSPNKAMIYLNLFYATITGVFIFIEWYVFTPILAFVVLLYGVFLSVYALGDIWGHLVTRTIPGSDAYALYEESGKYCKPKCVGIQWFIIAVFLQLFGIWLALVLMSEECQDRRWTECVLSDRPFEFFDDLFDDIDLNLDFDKWFDNH
mmetsp:Transcript_31221/g.47830  ORF Transcript_31221/g.47830 Transcript_31221/m.47830 type:complete len:273 (+) Transcript_31221:127-945(+)|eukprot:CAMPEP_0195283162 /NCGR_PEP_ID=MMETSP0707-20130614/1801_1 /TAXON_ID=33640 /ORGANISM="Asterionellopsis glacialis, Strain CCMP134" /LENGTH=272 /DNA_ID=CAMNT_0040342287 /DNA_START=55 /DNA_END=873 /DNA_ORIENTATION=+